jgi:hypothetical protein
MNMGNNIPMLWISTDIYESYITQAENVQRHFAKEDIYASEEKTV